MLFIHNPVPSDRELKVKFNDSDCSKKCDVTRFVITSVFLYLLVSLLCIILDYPVSLISIVIPSIVLVYAIIVLSGEQRRDLWLCAFVAFAGLILKLLAIIAFFMIYPLRKDEVVPKVIQARKRAGLFGWTTQEEKAIFFCIFFVVEFVFLILTCCLQCHLAVFRGRPSRNIPTETGTGRTATRTTRRSPNIGHPV